MSNEMKIPDTEEAWENGQLGRDEAHVVVDTGDDLRDLDERLGLKAISIRLEKSLIDDFKKLAYLNNGMGYQTLMRQALKRFAECEMKQLLRNTYAEVKKSRESVEVAADSASSGTDDASLKVA